jgi:hypothetical protein
MSYQVWECGLIEHIPKRKAQKPTPELRRNIQPDRSTFIRHETGAETSRRSLSLMAS